MQFIDLNPQYKRIEKDLKERIEKVLTNKNFIMGQEVVELEKKLADFAGTKYAYTCSSGTDALVLPLMAYNLQKDDAVFVSSFTFFASAESVNLSGGTPVFIDSDSTFNINPDCLRSTIEKTIKDGRLKPRGIIAVDIFGLAADYDSIIQIANEYNLFVIEDAAQSFGGSYKGKMNGSFGDVGATSFFPAKPLGCYGDGGAIFTDNDNLAELIHSLRVHGQGSYRYDNVRIGMNGRMDTLQAAVLLSKIDILKSEIDARQSIAAQYMDELDGVFKLPEIPKDRISAWAQFTLMAEDENQRNIIIEKMKSFNIPIMIYYPVPMHMQTAYKYLGYKENDIPVAADISKKVFSLPMYPYLTKEEISFVCEKLKSVR